MIGLSVIYSLFLLTISVYLSLLILLVIGLRIYFGIRNWSRIYPYISKIEIDPTCEVVILDYVKNNEVYNLKLKFKSYSLILRRKSLINEFRHFEIIYAKPYKVLFRQYLVGDWEEDTGLNILEKYADKTIEPEKTFKPF